MVAIMSLPIERLAALFALAYVGLFVGLIAFTTNGPDATLQPADEMARAVEGMRMRASALLGFAASIAFSGFATGLLHVLRLGDTRGAALTAVAGGLVEAAIDAVSAAALITAVEAADRDLGAGVLAASPGDLHTAALLFVFLRSASSCCSRGASTLDYVALWLGVRRRSWVCARGRGSDEPRTSIKRTEQEGRSDSLSSSGSSVFRSGS